MQPRRETVALPWRPHSGLGDASMTPAGNKPLSVYLAGPLFSHADLLGNAMLAEAVGARSGGRFVAILPQDQETALSSAREVRDRDLEDLLAADLAVFNFSGPEIDAGAVMEFAYAKLLDLPAVILRTDSRAAGEDLPDADSWNLMCSFYPRTEAVKVNAPATYEALRVQGRSSADAARLLIEEVADRVIEALDRAWNLPAVLPPNPDRQRIIYEWAATFIGTTRSGDAIKAHVQRTLSRRRTPGAPAGGATSGPR